MKKIKITIAPAPKVNKDLIKQGFLTDPQVQLAEFIKAKYKPTDIGVFFGTVKKGMKTKLYNKLLKNNVKPMFFESSILGIYSSFGVEYNDNFYHRVGFDHWMYDLGNFHDSNSPNDRWENHKKLFNIDYKPWRKDGDYILVCLSLDGDPTTRDVNQIVWLEKTVKELRKHTDRKIIVRPHPNSIYISNIYESIASFKKHNVFHSQRLLINYSKQINRETWHDRRSNIKQDLENAWAVVLQAGRTSIICAFEGIPFFSTVGSFGYPISYDANEQLSLIESPKMPDRYQWFCDMAYCEWSRKEIREGVAWAHFKRYYINQ